MGLILASQSPRRKELLGLFHIPFTVCVADVDETMDPAKHPFDEVERVSRLKAQAIFRKPGDVVIAADTIVVCQHKVLGKPHTEAEAAQMLNMLSGNTHTVATGVTIVTDEKTVTFTEITNVRFRPMSQQEIEAYIASGEPMDKAGSYGIQGRGALFVESITGDYYNVMGLPVCSLWKELQKNIPEIMEENR